MTDQSLPEPLTAADSDLQDFAFMPLHVSRLRDSDLAAEEEPEACWYALLLWAASWHQLPAGSLPDNDAVLMRLVGLGRDKATWQQHRDGALRGFVLCSDGRLYHPVVAEQVNNAWAEKLAYRDRKAARKSIAEKAAAKRWSVGNVDADADVVHGADASTMHDALHGDASCMVDAMPKGRGRGTGTGNNVEDERERDANANGVTKSVTPPAEPGVPGKGLYGDLARIVDAAGIAYLDPSREKWAHGITRLKGWYDKGYELERDILPAIQRTLRTLPAGETIGSLAKLERELFGQRAKAAAFAQPKPAQAASIDFAKPDETDEMREWRTAAAVTMKAAPYRNLLDGAALAIADGELVITVADALSETRISSEFMFMLQPLAARFLGTRLVRVVVNEQRKAA